MLNVAVLSLKFYKPNQDVALVKTSTTNNDFAINVTSMYDTENIEP